MEGDGQIIDLDPGSIRREYLARMHTFLGQVRRACGEAACDYVPLRTDKPLGDALADYLLPAVEALKRHRDYLRANPARRIERQMPLPP